MQYLRLFTSKLLPAGPVHPGRVAGPTSSPRRRNRRGVSLLEVMFSIGVAMVGLVGIAALLPVAGALSNKAVTTDRATRLAADAVREFHVRSMANPATWRWFDPSGGQFRPVTVSEIAAGNSFCLDPRFVAQGNVLGDHAARNGFPYLDDLYGSGTILAMPRMTLSPNALGTLPPNSFMGRLQANQIFVGDDDLAFELPRDRTLGPVQLFSRNSAAPAVPLKRSTDGQISWMATAVPKLDRMGNLTDEYTLSVVVFSRRIIDPTLTNENLASERVVLVRNFFSGQPAVGGGDLQLATRRNNPDDLQLRSGDWVMLASFKVRPGISMPLPVFQWYRVANAGEEPVFDAPSSTWLREVTLVGPDWDWGHMANNTPTQYITSTQVTIVRGVSAVFEKTIRLETSSLWTN